MTEIEQTAVEYFQEIFSSSSITDLEISLEYFLVSVTPKINDFLLRELSTSEVKAAIFSIHPEKVHGRME